MAISVLLLCLLLLRCRTKDGFSTGPSKQEIAQRATQLLKFKDSIQEGLYAAKINMPWIDPVTYEDARKLLRHNKYNNQDLIQILG